ncbi:ROK family protein [Pseudoclavibacter sp. RFBB5]|uniref:ROK family protein n=1 Tax=Pseudoclavibacter sp. RFBB5 TaxID=2080574 RepID=UPI0015E1F6A7|nr:ROK family protein [Pseudoclavibacter sp. RFBB5]
MSNGQLSPQDAFVHGQLINLIRSGRANTRPALVRATGLSRRIVSECVSQAVETGLVDDSEFAVADIGRPSRLLRFRSEVGVVYVGVIESSQLWAAVATLSGSLVDSMHLTWDAAVGPVDTLNALKQMFEQLAARGHATPWAIGIGVSGIVDFQRGRLVSSPLLTGWTDFSIRSFLRQHYDAPVWVERDVNVMALGEWHLGSPATEDDLMYVLVDEEVGAAVVTQGLIHRGRSGATGAIGHMRVTDDPSFPCRCGRTGCLDAVVAGWSLAERLSARAMESAFLAARIRGKELLTAEDVGDAARAGDPVAAEEVRARIRFLGSALAPHVNFANPGTLVIGGGLIRIGDWTVDLLEQALREGLTPDALEPLSIRAASLDYREGLVGSAILAVEQLFAADTVGLWIDQGSPVGRAASLQDLLAD